MRKVIVVLAAASIFAVTSHATARVTGIRHSDGSWTFVDANGRDIHKNYDAGRVTRHDAAHARSRTSRHDEENHRVTGYLPWQSR
jgi:hypothetical protein